MTVLLRILPAGDTGLVIEFGDRIDARLNSLVHDFDSAFLATAPTGLVETIATYRSILALYDPLLTDAETLAACARNVAATLASAAVPKGRRYAIPVAFGGIYGIDLDDVAKALKMTPQAVIGAHSTADYRVYMLGFSPGFAYLGGLPPSLAVPRRDTPRLATPAGTFMQGGQQAAISPLEMPSGWHLLGRTPLRLFDLRRSNPFLLGPGDLIRIVPIDADRFEALAGAVEKAPVDPESEALS